MSAERISFYLLLVIAVAGFQAVRAGQGGAWLKAKFWNTAEAAPDGLGWGQVLGSASSTLGTPTAPTGAAPTGSTAPADQITLEGTGITVHRSIASRVKAMVVAAQGDGIALRGTGWRSSERQIELRRQHCGTSHYDIYDKPSSQCHPPTARPGRSQHEKGLAIDFDLGPGVLTWLKANAASFGLYNLPSEAWHWSVNGQ